jgi:hypothetical protein
MSGVEYIIGLILLFLINIVGFICNTWYAVGVVNYYLAGINMILCLVCVAYLWKETK